MRYAWRALQAVGGGWWPRGYIGRFSRLCQSASAILVSVPLGRPSAPHHRLASPSSTEVDSFFIAPLQDCPAVVRRPIEPLSQAAVISAMLDSAAVSCRLPVLSAISIDFGYMIGYM